MVGRVQYGIVGGKGASRSQRRCGLYRIPNCMSEWDRNSLFDEVSRPVEGRWESSRRGRWTREMDRSGKYLVGMKEDDNPRSNED